MVADKLCAKVCHPIRTKTILNGTCDSAALKHTRTNKQLQLQPVFILSCCCCTPCRPWRKNLPQLQMAARPRAARYDCVWMTVSVSVRQSRCSLQKICETKVKNLLHLAPPRTNSGHRRPAAGPHQRRATLHREPNHWAAFVGLLGSNEAEEKHHQLCTRWELTEHVRLRERISRPRFLKGQTHRPTAKHSNEQDVLLSAREKVK